MGFAVGFWGSEDGPADIEVDGRGFVGLVFKDAGGGTGSSESSSSPSSSAENAARLDSGVAAGDLEARLFADDTGLDGRTMMVVQKAKSRS